MRPNRLVRPRDLRALAAIAAALLLPAQAPAQVGAPSSELLSIESGGESIVYQLRRFPPRPAVADAEEPAPDSAIGTARLIAKHLASDDIEEAALLSNAPKRRYEVLTDYRESVGPEEFKRVFGEYADPRNPVIAEIAIGPRRVLVWRLGQAGSLAAQYYVEVDGRFLLDDVPSDERARLRRVFEAYRAGALGLPAPKE